jgi:serine protease Do
MARDVMESIVKDGQVTRGYLGAMIQDLNEDLAESFGFDTAEGVLVGDVVEDGPAAKAGLQPGDIVVSFDGKKMANANQLRNAVAATDPNTASKLEIYRDGNRRTLTVSIGVLDSDQICSARPGSVSNNELGMNVETLTPEVARELGYDRDTRGVVVTQVDPSGLAARVGIRPGDMVVSVGGTPIQSLADFRQALQDRDVEAGIRMQIQRDGVRRFVYLKSR